MRNTSFKFVAIMLSLSASNVTTADPITNLPAGHWYRIPDSKLRSVVPSQSPGGNTGFAAIMSAWSGGTFDTIRDRLVVWGGGHNDYAGNELYVFDLNSMTWSRVTDPSVPTGGSEGGGVYGDGRPRSTHSYNALSFSARTGKFYFMGMGSVWQNGGHSHHSGSFNFQSRSWEAIAPKPPIGTNSANISAYDSQTGRIWVHAGDERRMLSYDTESNDWQTYDAWPQWPPLSLYATAAISAPDRQMVAVGNGQFMVWALNNPTSVSTPQTDGPFSMIDAQAPGFVFDTESKKYVGWAGGSHVYTLDPNSMEWMQVDPKPTNTVEPSNPSRWGTYGRFQYSPNRNVFVLVNSIDEDVYIYRLSDAGGVSLVHPKSPSDLRAE